MDKSPLQFLPFPLWGSLRRGPYGVGFQQRFSCDRARAYDLPFGEREPGARARRPRPILLNIWYPAEPSGCGTPMLYREYLELAPDDPQLEEFTKSLVNFNRRVLCSEVMHKPEKELDAAERAAFDQMLATPTAAIRNAVAAHGGFPLVLNHPGLGGAFEDNAVLFEYLASHGYVVASSAFQSEDASNPGIDWGIERSLKDLDYLVNFVMAHYAAVNGQPIGVMGQSYGAQAAIGWAAEKNAAVAAVVTFDSTLENGSPAWKVWGPLEERLKRIVNLSAPMLLFCRDQPSSSFDRYDPLKYVERYYAKVRHLGHNDFLSHGAIGSDIRLRLQPDASESALIRQGYDLVCIHTLRFLDAYLKGAPAALEALRDAAASGDAVSGLFRLQYRQAAPLPPTAKQFLDRLQSHGLAEAVRSFSGFRGEIDYRVLESVADRLFDDGNIDAAIEVSKLNTQWCPRSARAWEWLSRVYQETGERELALVACNEALKWIADDPLLTEHERWLSQNSLSEAVRELQGG